jgi:hypothetical protein
LLTLLNFSIVPVGVGIFLDWLLAFLLNIGLWSLQLLFISLVKVIFCFDLDKILTLLDLILGDWVIGLATSVDEAIELVDLHLLVSGMLLHIFVERIWLHLGDELDRLYSSEGKLLFIEVEVGLTIDYKSKFDGNEDSNSNKETTKTIGKVGDGITPETSGNA